MSSSEYSTSSSSSSDRKPHILKRKRLISFGQNVRTSIPNREDTIQEMKVELEQQGIPLKLHKTSKNEAEEEIGFNDIYNSHKGQIKSPKIMFALHRTISNQGDINSQLLRNTYSNAKSKKSKKIIDRGWITTKRERLKDIQYRKREEGMISERESSKMDLEDRDARGLKNKTRKNKKTNKTKKMYNNKKSKKHKKNKKNK